MISGWTVRVTEKHPITVQWDFLVLFILFIGVFAGIAEMGHGYKLAFREFTASAITALWGFFSVPVSCSATQLTIAGFPMEIVLECTALHYMIIFVSGVLAFRSHTLKYRALGVLIGTLAIFLLNIARIGMIGFIGQYFNSVFDFAHEYLWRGMFALSVLFCWILWVNGKKVFSRRLTVTLFIAAVSALLSFALVVTYLESYIKLVAVLSNVMFPVLSAVMDVPQRVIAEGRLIVYEVGNLVVDSKVTYYFMNAALLLPVALITYVRSEWKIFLKRLSVAIVLTLTQHLFIIALDWMQEVTVASVHPAIMWCIILTTFVSPLLIWLFVMKIFRAEPAAER